MQVTVRFVGENHGRHGKRRRSIYLSNSVLIVANSEVGKMFKTLELFLVSINEQGKYPKMHSKKSDWHF